MLLRDRLYSAYRDSLQEIIRLRDTGLQTFLESKRYHKIRQRYLELRATLPNPLLDKRVNDLLEGARDDKTIKNKKKRK